MGVEWNCKNCGSKCESESQDEFDTCWKCGIKTSVADAINTKRITVWAMSEKHKNIILSVVLGMAVLFACFQPLDSSAQKQIEDGFQRSLTSYVVAKSLNAIISFAQGTELSFQIGVGATIAPGQALDPVNDLVEQFAELMLAASVAFGIMLILVKIGSYWLFSLLLTIGISIWLYMRWKSIRIPDLLTKIVVALLFVRFSMPMVAFGSDFVYKQFLEDNYKQSQSALDQSSNDISSKGKEFEIEENGDAESPIQPITEPSAPPTENVGVMQKLKEKAVNGLNALKSGAQNVIEKLKESLIKF